MIGLQKKREEAARAAALVCVKDDGIRIDDEIGMNEGSTNQSGENDNVIDAAVARGRGRGRGISIFGVKNGSAPKGKPGRKLRPGEIRVQKDVSGLDGGDCAKPVFPNPDDLMNFQVIVSPDDGYWKGYQFTFDFTVPDMYPHEPPIVKCRDKIYHPNIDLSGNVCLNILRADWKPVLDINAIIYGLIVLFVQPNPDDPLNDKAAETLRTNVAKFRQNVNESLRGHTVDREPFPPAKKAFAKPRY